MPPSERYRGRHACPHCSGPAKIRSVREVSPTFREVYLDCNGEPECGWRGVASFVIERTIAQTGRPNPAVSLPTTPPRRKPSGLPAPANDDGSREVQAAL